MNIDSSLLEMEHIDDQGTRLSRWVVWVLCALVLAAYATTPLLPLTTGLRTLWVAYVYLVPSGLALAVAAFTLALGVRSQERPFWICLLLALLAFLVGDAYFAWHQTTAFQLGAVGSSDVLTLCGYGLLIAALATWSSLRRLGRRARTRALLDVVAVSAAVFVVLFGFAAVPLQSSAGARAATLMVPMLFPLADTALAAALAMAVLGFKRAPWTRWQVAVAVGVIALLIGDLVAFLGSAGAAHGVGGQVAQTSGLAWVVGYLALFVAGSLRLLDGGEREAASVVVPATPDGIGWRELAGLAVVVVAVPLMMLAAHEASLPSLIVLGGAGVVLSGAVIARIMLSGTEIARLRVAVTVDEVTGSHNARYVREMVSDRVAAATLAGDSVTLALVDLDGLDVINEALGRESGDRTLRELADIIAHASRPDEMGRIDGGRFAAVFTGARSFDAYVSCRTIVERAARAPGVDAIASVSCGLAAYPAHAATAGELMDHADMAARAAARRGGGSVTVFDPDTMIQVQADSERTEHADPVRTLQSLAGVIDASDPDTRSHSANVSLLAAALGSRIGLDDEHVERLRVAGTLHDVGKVGIPEHVLHKAGGLSESEMGAIRSHPELGARMLQATEAAEIAPWVLAHHERWDGAGYPDGVAGSAIPIAARIIAVADAYDAMTSTQPWRDAFSVEYALGQLADGAGAQFDPQLVAEFRAMIERHGDPRRGSFASNEGPARRAG
jgi:diguanylate cyclase (GGDEF)-like protein/putative nucleotidyltransferase with HDIG domain